MNKWTQAFEWNRASAEPAGRRNAPLAHHYHGFLSYSHEDTNEADWLHDQLERFRVPRSLAGTLNSSGVVPKRLTPIFRDRHELAAADNLNEEIRQGLAASRTLIVLCSPASARSKWVNAEIRMFKRLHPESCVIAAIIAGEPLASDVPGREANDCFPPALRQKYNRRGRPTGKASDPLAADLREGKGGRRIGFLKIIAGILGVGLDDLVQRNEVRRQRRLALISSGSLAAMIVAIALAVTAFQARDAARDQRREAEGLIGFMLGDLKDKLEPIGRLDILDSVGAKALAYYRQQNTADLSDEALAQRSKALTLLGQVASTRGDLDRALGFYRAAFDGTAEALRRNPGDGQRIYDHAQNVFYVGDIAHNRGQLRQAEAAMREYKRLATRLIAIDPANPDWQMEGIYADTNLGVMLNDSGRYSEAAAVFENALVAREKLEADDPSNPKYKKALLEGLAWLAQAREDGGRLGEALSARLRQVAILDPLIAGDSADADYQRQAAVAYLAAGRISANLGDTARGIALLRHSLAITDRLAAAEPANTNTMGRAAWAKFELARIETATGAGDAGELVRNGCDLTDRLVAKDPSFMEWRLDLRTACFDAEARAALSRRDFASASQAADRLVANANDEIRRADSASARLARAEGFMLQGLIYRAEGQARSAVSAFRRADESWPRSAPPQPSSLSKRTVILRGIGRIAEADLLARQLQQMGYVDATYRDDLRRVG